MSKKQNERMVKFALPVGSLNNVDRGNTSQLLADAGYDVEGYRPGKESMKPRFVNDPKIDAFADRPQNMPPALDEGVYDLAILGSDWVREWQLAGIEESIKICELDYGNIDVVVAVREVNRIRSLEKLVERSWFDEGSGKFIKNPRDLLNNPIRIRTEYLNIAKDAVEKAAQFDGRIDFSSTVYRDSAGAPCVVIEQSYGRTEVGMMNGNSVDAIVEATQTGSSLKAAGLRIIKTVFSSTACIYASTYAMEEQPKREKISEIASLLEGAVRKRSFEYVTFNVEEGKLQSVVNYLKEKGCAAKAPTVSIYASNAVVSTLLPKKDYPCIVPELLRLGADDIVRLEASQIVSGGGERK